MSTQGRRRSLMKAEMNKERERKRTLEELEGQQWPQPPAGSTGLVKTVHRLRQRPVGELTAYELVRLVGQDAGLRWTLPLALEILRDTTPEQSTGGFYDDDLLSAVLTRKAVVWAAHRDLVGEMREILDLLTDLSPCIERDVEKFLQASEGIG
ncbi:contact-dependent growth inhibition system immunity protein [Streptomyces sp. NBC_01408]|uniref:contact-dependent growth inhibition system immunity protein n=1 Tax=Streptomyces sp. NBC_01408 TaxID=2903855 RepID=UPI00224D8C8D|nr:contact-dependent growth inhibition system immunity protein [Streptomyces sp. NBC_01408]MCX4692678.1 contact-dependent growth inhibition system immunity protein [Streptomyces sp. NBC_01408]